MRVQSKPFSKNGSSEKSKGRSRPWSSITDESKGAFERRLAIEMCLKQ